MHTVLIILGTDFVTIILKAELFESCTVVTKVRKALEAVAGDYLLIPFEYQHLHKNFR